MEFMLTYTDKRRIGIFNVIDHAETINKVLIICYMET